MEATEKQNNQPWNLKCRAGTQNRHWWYSKIAPVRFLGVKFNCSLTKNCRYIHTRFFSLQWTLLIWQGPRVLKTLNTTQQHSKKCSKWLFFIVEKPIARCPSASLEPGFYLHVLTERKQKTKQKKKKKEISAVNFSTAKMILFLGILTESQFFRSLHLCTSQVGMGEKIGIWSSGNFWPQIFRW